MASENSVGASLKVVRGTLKTARIYDHAASIINYDQETICPSAGMQAQGEVLAFLENQSFRLTKDQKFIEAAENLFAHRKQLDPPDKVLADNLHREYLKVKNISPEKDLEFSKILSQSFVDWLGAKKASDFSLFQNSLSKVKELQLEQIALREYDAGNGDTLGSDPNLSPATPYDALLGDYERGVTQDDLDIAFGKFAERMTPLLKEIMARGKKIRTDFLSRRVTDLQQQQMADYLLDLIGFDKNRGAWTTTEHPFTDSLGKDDARVTTHYYPTAFLSSMFSVIHEGGHALFMQLQPENDYLHFINDTQTMGQHESVSRFYENRIGRSRAFISLIYPKCREIFPQVFEDVSEQEFYEAVNVVQPSLIRTEADEFTYTFHIIIRYELEKQIVNGGLAVDEKLPGIWNDMYEKYLDVRPSSDREGILQDVHWASGFGYFPTYALGNMYNAMYYNRMAQDLDIENVVGSGDFAALNKWMQSRVFAKANYLAPKEWIKDITGREFTPDDFLDYLEKKYTKLYRL